MYSVIVCVDLEQYHLLFISQYELLLNHLLTGCKTIKIDEKHMFSVDFLSKSYENVCRILQICYKY